MVARLFIKNLTLSPDFLAGSEFVRFFVVISAFLKSTLSPDFSGWVKNALSSCLLSMTLVPVSLAGSKFAFLFWLTYPFEKP